MASTALFPTEASTQAPTTDAIFLGLTGLSTLILLLVTGLVVVFSIRYRRGSAAPRGPLPRLLQRELELGWTVATLFLFMAIFGWAAAQNFAFLRPPANALQIHVVAKQWMWKIQHPGGQREIDALHLPLGRAVHLSLNSQDVIHDFYVPAFRLKHDVVPGHTEELWFQPSKTGSFHLFCAEYCGSQHAAMLGTITVMPPEDYARWLAEQPSEGDLVAQGKGLFTTFGCAGCHAAGATVHAPSLAGIYNHPVPLSDGRVVTADDRYLRDSILMPRRDIAAGYPAIMPNFAGHLGDDDVQKLVAYIKSLSPGAQETRP